MQVAMIVIIKMLRTNLWLTTIESDEVAPLRHRSIWLGRAL